MFHRESHMFLGAVDDQRTVYCQTCTKRLKKDMYKNDTYTNMYDPTCSQSNRISMKFVGKFQILSLFENANSRIVFRILKIIWSKRLVFKISFL